MDGAHWRVAHFDQANPLDDAKVFGSRRLRPRRTVFNLPPRHRTLHGPSRLAPLYASPVVLTNPLRLQHHRRPQDTDRDGIHQQARK